MRPLAFPRPRPILDPTVEAARLGRNLNTAYVSDTTRFDRLGQRLPTVDEAKQILDAEVAQFIAEHGVTKLPARSGLTGPAITKIRQAQRQGKPITFNRGGTRTITFSAPEPGQGQAAGEHPRAAATRRRRKSGGRQKNTRPE